MKRLLRNAVKADIPTFFRFQSDPESNRLVGFVPRTRPDFESRWARILADGEIEKKAIVEGRSVVGFLVCFMRDGRREVGYWIDRAHWGKGLASRALAEFLIGYCRRPLYALVSKSNDRSLRVAEKSGFRRVGEQESTNNAGLTTRLFVLELGADRAAKERVAEPPRF